MVIPDATAPPLVLNQCVEHHNILVLENIIPIKVPQFKISWLAVFQTKAWIQVLCFHVLFFKTH